MLISIRRKKKVGESPSIETHPLNKDLSLGHKSDHIYKGGYLSSWAYSIKLSEGQAKAVTCTSSKNTARHMLASSPDIWSGRSVDGCHVRVMDLYLLSKNTGFPMAPLLRLETTTAPESQHLAVKGDPPMGMPRYLMSILWSPIGFKQQKMDGYMDGDNLELKTPLPCDTYCGSKLFKQ